MASTTEEVLQRHVKLHSVEGDFGYPLWSAETADNVYEIATDTQVVRDGKIVA